jgi:uncharacterized protein YozE (UPF0346 family)
VIRDQETGREPGVVRTFRAWLLAEYPEVTDDDVSHLAYDVRDDTDWPVTSTREAARQHLEDCNAAPEALEAFERAWALYTSEI